MAELEPSGGVNMLAFWIGVGAYVACSIIAVGYFANRSGRERGVASAHCETAVICTVFGLLPVVLLVWFGVWLATPEKPKPKPKEWSPDANAVIERMTGGRFVTRASEAISPGQFVTRASKQRDEIGPAPEEAASKPEHVQKEVQFADGRWTFLGKPLEHVAYLVVNQDGRFWQENAGHGCGWTLEPRQTWTPSQLPFIHAMSWHPVPVCLPSEWTWDRRADWLPFAAGPVILPMDAFDGQGQYRGYP